MDAISPELLEILVCPETHQKVRPAEAELRLRLIAQQEAGTLVNRAGNKVETRIQDALVREDGKYAYLIVDAIPVMLIDEAIPLS